MNRIKRDRNKKLRKKESHSTNRLGCVITVIVLIPVLWGVYLYCQQINIQRNNEPPTNASLQIPFGEEWGVPLSSVTRQEQIIRHGGYTVSYNKDFKIPNWVSYELTREETEGKEKRSNRFIADPLVAAGSIATNADYARSGYDKGHMAPAADMKWSREAMTESFYFSNICPQHPQLNRRGWKNLEEKIRDWAIADSAIIICGPIVEKQPKTIGKNKVAVPQQFFKAVLSPFVKPIRAIGFLFNNEQAVEPPSSYTVTIDSIERLTGMDFFTPLSDEIENKIEAGTDYSLWPEPNNRSFR